MLHQVWDIIRYADLWLNSASFMINGMLQSGWQLPRNNMFMWVSSVLVRLLDKKEHRKKNYFPAKCINYFRNDISCS